MGRRGITHVVLHDMKLYDATVATGTFEEIARGEDIVIFRLRLR